MVRESERGGGGVWGGSEGTEAGPGEGPGGEPVRQFRCCRRSRGQCGSRSQEHLFIREAEEWFLDRRGRLGRWSGSTGDLPAGKSRRAGREPGWCRLLLARGREGEGQSRTGRLLLLRPLSPRQTDVGSVSSHLSWPPAVSRTGSRCPPILTFPCSPLPGLPRCG